MRLFLRTVLSGTIISVSSPFKVQQKIVGKMKRKNQSFFKIKQAKQIPFASVAFGAGKKTRNRHTLPIRDYKPVSKFTVSLAQYGM
jgi:hypothetical protein